MRNDGMQYKSLWSIESRYVYLMRVWSNNVLIRPWRETRERDIPEEAEEETVQGSVEWIVRNTTWRRVDWTIRVQWIITRSRSGYLSRRWNHKSDDKLWGAGDWHEFKITIVSTVSVVKKNHYMKQICIASRYIRKTEEKWTDAGPYESQEV